MRWLTSSVDCRTAPNGSPMRACSRYSENRPSTRFCSRWARSRAVVTSEMAWSWMNWGRDRSSSALAGQMRANSRMVHSGADSTTIRDGMPKTITASAI